MNNESSPSKKYRNTGTGKSIKIKNTYIRITANYDEQQLSFIFFNANSNFLHIISINIRGCEVDFVSVAPCVVSSSRLLCVSRSQPHKLFLFKL